MTQVLKGKAQQRCEDIISGYMMDRGTIVTIQILATCTKSLRHISCV